MKYFSVFSLSVLAKVFICYITLRLVQSAKKRGVHCKTETHRLDFKIIIIIVNEYLLQLFSLFGCVLQRCGLLCREARIRDVCRMWKSDPWPVHTESLSRPGVACSLPEVCRVQPVPGWDLHLFRPGRQNLLQKRLCKVGVWKYSPYRLNHVLPFLNVTLDVFKCNKKLCYKEAGHNLKIEFRLKRKVRKKQN